MFYGKDQGGAYEDVENLDMSGKGVLSMDNIDVFEKLVNLRTLDISEHPEFMLTDEQMRQKEEEMKEGSAQAD
jgi:hypothetical protein